MVHNYWTKDLVTGGKEMWWTPKYDEIPVFVKVLLFRNTQFNNMGNWVDELTLDLYYKGKRKSVVSL
jgi:alpha-glucosidase